MTRRRNAPARVCALVLVVAGATGCVQEESFPNQIPAVVAALGQFHSSWSARERVRFDSVCVDRELYDELVNVFGDDSLAVLTRRIHNPVDSAAVVMTVARYDRAAGAEGERYEFDLYMRREGDRFWIVAHRLTRSLP